MNARLATASWTHSGLVFLFAALLMLVVGLAQAQEQVRIRKNIDALTPEELSNYVHALDILKKRDPTRHDSYTWLAQLHNDLDVGPCEHANDKFFPWHRAHLLVFEDALRAADPPRTSNVTIPYWNWSVQASGVRYAKAFEEAGSPLHDAARNSAATPPSFPSQAICRVLRTKGWQLFAGRSTGGYGTFEQPAHNDMHSRYIGGLMGNPATASEDPIYWSYHAYIDALMVEWESRPGNAVDSCLNCKMRGFDKPVTVDELRLANFSKKVRYEYQSPAGCFEPAFGAAPALRLGLRNSLSATQEPVAVITRKAVKLPEDRGNGVYVEIGDVPLREDLSVEGNVFIYPPGVAFNPRNAAFREKYYAGFYSVWRTHLHDKAKPGLEHHAATTSLRVDITEFVGLQKATDATKAWNMSVVVFVIPEKPDQPPAFGAIGPDPQALRSALSFESIKLVAE